MYTDQNKAALRQPPHQPRMLARRNQMMDGMPEDYGRRDKSRVATVRASRSAHTWRSIFLRPG